MIAEGFEVASATSIVSITAQACFKIGNRVCISFSCRLSGDATFETPFAVIPMEYRPKADIPKAYGTISMTDPNAVRAGVARIFSNSGHPHGLIGQILTSKVLSGASVAFAFEYYI